MMGKYRRDGTPYPDNVAGLFEWAKDIADPAKKIVKQERVGRFWISTVWLGLDHSFCFHLGECDCKPLIFESMVFDHRKIRVRSFLGRKFEVAEDKAQIRYSSLDDALYGHAELCRAFKKSDNKARKKGNYGHSRKGRKN